jgi:1-acyl-sn-glycerol-3-phosphate acyltransferase
MTPVAALGRISDARRHPEQAANRTGWEPLSPCQPQCLPAPDSLPRVGRARVVARFAGLISSVLLFALAAVVLPAHRRAPVLRGIFRGVLRAIGVRLVHRGDDRFDAGPGTGGVLVVANHLSWLDILVLGAVQPMRMVAKREVQDWPVLGAVAVRVGTLFIDRGGLRSLPSVVSAATDALRAGAVVGLFPEGTTWCGAAVGPFRRAGFQAALDAGAPVRPVAQRMLLLDGTVTSVGAFIGEDTLCDSLLRVLSLPGLSVEVDVLPLLAIGQCTDRRELARRAELAVAAVTGVSAPALSRRTTAIPQQLSAVA